jgi:hypothetical protein
MVISFFLCGRLSQKKKLVFHKIRVFLAVVKILFFGRLLFVAIVFLNFFFLSKSIKKMLSTARVLSKQQSIFSRSFVSSKAVESKIT